ncbi:hypothetical protein BOX15_Mlig001265g11 [Macrostomum lignano]|uniref:J domain-containing protein n=1 Tax=Macrostomum lignano TaxID=282301 RepID=A0A267FXU4_9PLAT|nr:hypothetical protein BOX15_Mlig001265g11 [Macrostomum lignano]
MADLYECLGVQLWASAAQIRKAFYGRARELHPDKSATEETRKRFQECEEAYRILSCPFLRKLYDIFGNAVRDRDEMLRLAEGMLEDEDMPDDLREEIERLQESDRLAEEAYEREQARRDEEHVKMEASEEASDDEQDEEMNEASETLPEEYEVEKVLGVRVTERGAEYLLQWAGVEELETSWEAEEDCAGCRNLIEEYLQRAYRLQTRPCRPVTVAELENVGPSRKKLHQAMRKGDPWGIFEVLLALKGKCATALVDFKEFGPELMLQILGYLERDGRKYPGHGVRRWSRQACQAVYMSVMVVFPLFDLRRQGLVLGALRRLWDSCSD